MRADGLFLAATVAGSSAIAACGGGGGGGERGDPRPRGGSLVVSRSAVAGFDPEEGLTGVGAFFAPPGPDVSPTVPPGECEWSTPVPEPTAEPTDVAWRDAGGSLTLRSEPSALVLDRLDGPEGEILYLLQADAAPGSFVTGVSYALEIEGSGSAGGVPAAVLPNALVAPAAVGLYAPELALAPVPLARTPLQIGWTPGEDEAVAVIRMVISGTSGSATLTCATDDDGFYEIPETSMLQFPTGGGTMTVSRALRQETRLGDSWLHADAVLTEGGAVLLP